MTLDGTNTWLLSEPGSHEVVVVDPGPEHPEHLRRIVGALARRGFNQGMAMRIGREALDERIAGCEE